jgi:hypothetical protein
MGGQRRGLEKVGRLYEYVINKTLELGNATTHSRAAVHGLIHGSRSHR